jgi:thiamine biosynthesis protein ThiS
MPAAAPAAGAVSLRINGEERELAAGSTVASLVQELAPNARMIAVERNGEIVPRQRWTDVALERGDRIEIVRFVQGG